MATEVESILGSVKKGIGPSESYDYFEPDLIMHINSTFVILQQLGVGPSTGYAITGEEETWADFLPEDDPRFNAAKSYMLLKVKKAFDPPQSGILLQAMNEMIAEYEWRLCNPVSTD